LHSEKIHDFMSHQRSLRAPSREEYGSRTFVNAIMNYLYRCTVHSVVYLINTPSNAHILI